MLTIHTKTAKATRIIALSVFVLTITLIAQLYVPKKAHAAYDGGRLIDNSVFLDAKSMNTPQIQQFLNSRGGQLASRNFRLDCDTAGQQAKQIYLSLGAPCGGNASSASIIYYASQVYGVNPRVIIATLQKEQSLITATNPTDRQYAQAMGYACPTSGSCSDSSNFFWQIDNGTWVLRFHYERARGNMSWWYASSSWTCGIEKNFYKPNLYPGQNVNFYDQNNIHYRTHFIYNAATSAFYCYTPHAYNNPLGLYGRSPYGHTGMYYSGSYNFVLFYEMWFGTTIGTVHNDINYAPVFNADSYLNRYPDLKSVFGMDHAAAFRHFISYGIKEGRQASDNFNVHSYRNRYPDLRFEYGTNLAGYYEHYSVFGQREGRIATGTVVFTPITSYKGVNYSSVYNFTYYRNKNKDIDRTFGNDDAGAIIHFATFGMNEGRVANEQFNVHSYTNRHFDLRRVYKNNTKSYYLHYINYGHKEGRVATGNHYGGASGIDGIDYSSVYNFNTYYTSHIDIRNVFKLEDDHALRHFTTFGMNEGRVANEQFNVQKYRNRYSDLRQAFGNNLKSYYFHYMNHGKREGRIGN